VEAVKAFQTTNDTKLESVVPASSQTMMDLPAMESTTSSMEMDAVKGVCYQMLPSWKRERCKYLKMVDLVGIEPTTSSMPWKRAPSCATGPLFLGTLQAVRCGRP
jgi:hypothetical protein